ncbi:Sensors of blue-light using FAD [Hymenobacter arizonensis]|uniref:Sensors of blue-light using FAD n=2 Tax=Hymenobacter arizonensis TaxID=1227077 RepID=A0A1I6BHI9_HYMAR|nr:Sensors of blue-light using FAD [Hymenobacter arizonensis]
MTDPESLSAAQRRRLVAMAVALTAGTRLAPAAYERRLLADFEAGELTFAQLEDLLDRRVHQVLYHSRFAAPWGEADLVALLEWSRAHNAARGITGLLLCSDGCFVQVLEGAEAAVSDLYARIQRAPRHRDVVTVRQGLGPRRFAGWDMGFGYVQSPEMQHALAALDAPGPRLAPGVSDPQLRALLDAFE